MGSFESTVTDLSIYLSILKVHETYLNVVFISLFHKSAERTNLAWKKTIPDDSQIHGPWKIIVGRSIMDSFILSKLCIFLDGNCWVGFGWQKRILYKCFLNEDLNDYMFILFCKHNYKLFYFVHTTLIFKHNCKLPNYLF